MGRYAGNRHGPRSDIGSHEYMPLRQSGLNSREFTPSIRVIKRIKQHDPDAKAFTVGVNKVVKNKRPGGKKVKGNFKTPFHTTLTAEIISQKELAMQAKDAHYNPKVDRMRTIALLLRQRLENLHRKHPFYDVVRLEEVDIEKADVDKGEKRDKLVIVPEIPAKEQRVGGLAIAEALAPGLRIDPESIHGNPRIVIGSSDDRISERDFGIIKPDIEEIMPDEFKMETVVQLHSGLGRSGIEEFVIEP